MKIQRTILALTLSAFACGCGDSSTNASEGAPAVTKSGGGKLITNPEELPSDAAGLATVYEGILTKLVGILEDVDTEEQLAPAYEKIAKLKPAFHALMKRSEDLNLPVEEGINESLEALSTRLEEAMQGILQEFPTEAMSMMSAMSDFAVNR